jgi:hypothetical protein
LRVNQSGPSSLGCGASTESENPAESSAPEHRSQEQPQKHLTPIEQLRVLPRVLFFAPALFFKHRELTGDENAKGEKMISTALSNVAASLSQAQGQIPAGDTASVQALQQAYQLIAQVQNTYQGQ